VPQYRPPGWSKLVDKAKGLLGQTPAPGQQVPQSMAGPAPDAQPLAGPGATGLPGASPGSSQPLAGAPLGPEPASPNAAPQPASRSLIDRVKDTIKNLFPGKPSAAPSAVPGADDIEPPAKSAPLPNGPPPVAVMRMMIRQAGRAQTLLLFKYSGAWRLIEPYEIKAPKKPGGEPLFFMYCLLHDEIHSVYLSRAGGMVMTDEQFTPRWPVKVAT